MDADVRCAHDPPFPRNSISTTAHGSVATPVEDHGQIKFFVLNIFLLLKNMRKLDPEYLTKHAKKAKLLSS